MKSAERVMVALDVSSLREAHELVDALAPEGVAFKVGLELLTAEGAPAVVGAVKKAGGRVFFDGKFNDIPNTVGAASASAAALGVDFFDVHAASGLEAMKAAVKNKGKSRVLAVTVLTSLDEKACREIFGTTVKERVLSFAHLAGAAGVDGLVCSPQELEYLSEPGLPPLIKVIPGIRPAWAQTGDQKRVLTPKEAVRHGADYLVIGRPITQPPKTVGTPVDALRMICEELDSL